MNALVDRIAYDWAWVLGNIQGEFTQNEQRPLEVIFTAGFAARIMRMW